MENINKKVATLESLVDYLKTELATLNTLLLDCGFSEGIATLKASATEFLKGLN